MKTSNFIICDTRFPPQGWDVAWSAKRCQDGTEIVIDLDHPMTVAPGKWPSPAIGYDEIVVKR